jgi:hypothetical protein
MTMSHERLGFVTKLKSQNKKRRKKKKKKKMGIHLGMMPLAQVERMFSRTEVVDLQ